MNNSDNLCGMAGIGWFKSCCLECNACVCGEDVSSAYVLSLLHDGVLSAIYTAGHSGSVLQASRSVLLIIAAASPNS